MLIKLKIQLNFKTTYLPLGRLKNAWCFDLLLQDLWWEKAIVCGVEEKTFVPGVVGIKRHLYSSYRLLPEWRRFPATFPLLLKNNY